MEDAQPFDLLIVDDESEIRNGLSSAFQWRDLNARLIGCAANGGEALEILGRIPCDCVITDIRMPVMDGLELIRLSREKNLGADFVILSSYDDFAYAQAAMRYGVEEYLLKPISQKDLRAALERIFRRRVLIRRDAREKEALSRAAAALRIILMKAGDAEDDAARDRALARAAEMAEEALGGAQVLAHRVDAQRLLLLANARRRERGF